jgi:hypothetical protein
MKVTTIIKNEGGSGASPIKVVGIWTHDVVVWDEHLLGDVVPRG